MMSFYVLRGQAWNAHQILWEKRYAPVKQELFYGISASKISKKQVLDFIQQISCKEVSFLRTMIMIISITIIMQPKIVAWKVFHELLSIRLHRFQNWWSFRHWQNPKLCCPSQTWAFHWAGEWQLKPSLLCRGHSLQRASKKTWFW